MTTLVNALREWISNQRDPEPGGYYRTDTDMDQWDRKQELLDDLGEFLDRWEQEDE